MNSDALGLADHSLSRENLISPNKKLPPSIFENVYLRFLLDRIDKIFCKKNIDITSNKYLFYLKELEFSEIRSTLKSCLVNPEYHKSLIDLFSHGIADELILKIWSPAWTTPYRFVYQRNIELG